MRSKLMLSVTAAVMSFAIAGAANADGQDRMYNYRGGYIDLLEIVGDVEDTRGVPYALLKMADMKMMFYVDREAVYVTLDPNNPIITQQRPFTGYWVGYASNEEARWPDCPKDFMRDHLGVAHKLYGNLTWTNTGLDNTGARSFKIAIGHCDEPVEDWAFSGPQ